MRPFTTQLIFDFELLPPFLFVLYLHHISQFFANLSYLIHKAEWTKLSKSGKDSDCCY